MCAEEVENSPALTFTEFLGGAACAQSIEQNSTSLRVLITGAPIWRSASSPSLLTRFGSINQVRQLLAGLLDSDVFHSAATESVHLECTHGERVKNEEAEDRPSSAWARCEDPLHVSLLPRWGLLSFSDSRLFANFSGLGVFPTARQPAGDREQHDGNPHENQHLRPEVKDRLITPEDLGESVDRPGVDGQ